jgi:hypothetical protein
VNAQSTFLKSKRQTMNALATIAFGTAILLASPIAVGQTANLLSSDNSADWKQVEDAIGRAGQM